MTNVVAPVLQVSTLIGKWAAAQSQLEESEEAGSMSKEDWLKQQLARCVLCCSPPQVSAADQLQCLCNPVLIALAKSQQREAERQL
jgi:hypothetical protein